MWSLSSPKFEGTFEEAVEAGRARGKETGLCLTVVEVECTGPASDMWAQGQRVVLKPFFDYVGTVSHGNPDALTLWSAPSTFRLLRWWESCNGMRYQRP